MEKLIITAAICGAEVTKKHSPAVPYTVEEIAAEAYAAHIAGAAIIHLHVREDDGTPTQSKTRYQECMAAIKQKCPHVIIQVSTGGAVGMSVDERLQPVDLSPEMSTLDCGTLNFGGDEIFVNTENMIIKFAAKMKEHGVKPELECFDKSMIETVCRLARKGFIDSPMHFSFVMGVNGGIGGELRDFVFLKESLPQNSTFSAAGMGALEYPIAVASIISGGHVRVGLEDNIYLSKGILAQSNGELVEKAVRLSLELGREIASPDEARKILNINR